MFLEENVDYKNLRLKCGICGKWFSPKNKLQFSNLLTKAKKHNRFFYCSDECKSIKKGTKRCECPVCKKNFMVRKSALKSVNFCSKKCYYQSIKNPNTEHHFICQNCHKEYLIQKGSLRKFCSKACECEYKKKQLDMIIESNKLVSNSAMKNYLLRHNDKCMNPDCKWDWTDKNNPILELHHIDGCHLNNTLSNCILLCPNCHSLTDNYKNKLNRNSTRKRNAYHRNKDKNQLKLKQYREENNYISISKEWNKFMR